jgi:hypothetical protein
MLGIEAQNCEKTECKVLLDENQGFHIYKNVWREWNLHVGKIANRYNNKTGFD